MKRCSRCCEVRPIAEFGRHSREPDGLRRWCKPCEAAYTKDYRSKAGEARRAYGRQYHQDHREQRIAAAKKWQEANRERYRAHQRAYMTAYYADPANKERISVNGQKRWREKKEELSEKTRIYRKTQQGKAARAAAEHRRRARLRDGAPAASTKEVAKVLGAKCCHICGKPFTKKNPATLDHVIPCSKGGRHALSNLAAAHASCNSKKKTKHYNPITGQGLLL